MSNLSQAIRENPQDCRQFFDVWLRILHLEKRCDRMIEHVETKEARDGGKAETDDG